MQYKHLAINFPLFRNEEIFSPITLALVFPHGAKKVKQSRIAKGHSEKAALISIDIHSKAEQMLSVFELSSVKKNTVFMAHLKHSLS